MNPSPTGRRLMFLTRALVGVVVLAGAVVVLVALVETRPGVKLAGGRDQPARAAVYRITAARVHRQFRGYGSVRAREAANVPARVSGVVQSVPDRVRAGRRVTKGQVLARLDPSDFQADLRIAEHELDQLRARRRRVAGDRKELKSRVDLRERDVTLARHDLARAKRLNESAAANPQEVDRYTRQLLQAREALSTANQALSAIKPQLAQLDARIAGHKASVKLAGRKLERATVTSPLAGVLQSVNVKEGEHITAGRAVARVVDLRRVEVPLRLPAAARDHLSIGDRAVLTTTDTQEFTGPPRAADSAPASAPAPGGPGAKADAKAGLGADSGERPGPGAAGSGAKAAGSARRWEATVERIAPADNPSTRTVTVYLRVDQPGANARFAQSRGGGKARGGGGHGGASGASGGGRGSGDSRGGPLLVPGAFVSGRVTSEAGRRRLLVPRRALRQGRVRRVRDQVVEDLAVDRSFTLQGLWPTTGLADRQWAAIRPGDHGLHAGDLILVNAAAAAAGAGRKVQPVVVNRSPSPGAASGAGAGSKAGASGKGGGS